MYLKKDAVFLQEKETIVTALLHNTGSYKTVGLLNG